MVPEWRIEAFCTPASLPNVDLRHDADSAKSASEENFERTRYKG
jgi:hypothetical protein